MKKILLFALILVSSLSYTYASHLLASDITYRHIGGGQYEVTYREYRHCDAGVAANINFNFQSATCGQNIDVPTTQVITGEVTPICNLNNSVCNGGPVPGITEYVASVQVNLAQCSDWMIYVDRCCLTAGIMNVSSISLGGDLEGTRAFINNLNGHNSSPNYGNIPVIYSCLQSRGYDHQTNETDGDDLTYSFDNGYNYLPGANPIYGGSAIDPVSGELTISPSMVQESVFKVRTTETRSGSVIGWTQRNFYLNVIANCHILTPPPPTINYTLDVCATQDAILHANPDDEATYDYEWIEVNGAVETVIGTNSSSLTVQSGGCYKVHITDKVTICENESEIECISSSDLNSLEIIGPNKVCRTSQVELCIQSRSQADFPANTSISITDNQGNLLPMKNESGQIVYEIDVQSQSDFPICVTVPITKVEFYTAVYSTPSGCTGKSERHKVIRFNSDCILTSPCPGLGSKPLYSIENSSLHKINAVTFNSNDVACIGPNSGPTWVGSSTADHVKGRYYFATENGNTSKIVMHDYVSCQTTEVNVDPIAIPGQCIPFPGSSGKSVMELEYEDDGGEGILWGIFGCNFVNQGGIGILKYNATTLDLLDYYSLTDDVANVHRGSSTFDPSTGRIYFTTELVSFGFGTGPSTLVSANTASLSNDFSGPWPPPGIYNRSILPIQNCGSSIKECTNKYYELEYTGNDELVTIADKNGTWTLTKLKVDISGGSGNESATESDIVTDQPIGSFLSTYENFAGTSTYSKNRRMYYLHDRGTGNTITIDLSQSPAVISSYLSANARYELEIGDDCPINGIISNPGQNRSNSGNLMVSVYPNPSANGRFTVQPRLQNTNGVDNNVTNYSIVITDVYGKTVETISIVNNKTEVDISKQSKGVYFVRVQNGNQIEVAKVMYK